MNQAQNADRAMARPLAQLPTGGWDCRTLMPGLPARSVVHVAIRRRQAMATDRNEQSVIS